MLRFASVCLLSLAVASPAFAEPGDCLAEASPAAQASTAPIAFRRSGDDFTVLTARGTIDAGAAARLEEALASGRVEEVHFDSPGGDWGEAMRIGRLLRQRGLFVRIPAGASCTAACAEAFLGGIARIVEPGARLGFTALPLSDPASNESQAQREQAAARWAEAQADYYIRAGISRGLLRLQLDIPAPGICYLSETALRRYGVSNVGGLD